MASVWNISLETTTEAPKGIRLKTMNDLKLYKSEWVIKLLKSRYDIKFLY